MSDIKSPSTYVVLSKRKRQANLVLQLSGGSTCESDNDVVSEFSLSDNPQVPSTATHVIVNGKLVVDDKRRYRCTYDGCNKKYKKPSRLEEHERSHTGARPFAHSRSHLPESARSFACQHEDCTKKFWTAQHLKRHEEMHAGEKTFKCPEDGCPESFAKQYQLRSHTVTSHYPPGTKPYLCEYSECTKSFSTNQKFKAHVKIHEERRYVCSHSSCSEKEAQVYFSTWSALQTHSRLEHPAKCPYQSCNGKTFSQQKGLRAHLKIHEQREVELVLAGTVRDDGGEADDEHEDRPIKRRRGGEVGRDWKCTEEGCTKDFKSRRDFVCSIDECGASFGYKHLLRRHVARLHSTETGQGQDDFSDERDEAAEDSISQMTLKLSHKEPASAIDLLTGKAYDDRAKERILSQHALVCPYPNMPTLTTESSTFAQPLPSVVTDCTYVFSRAYDFHRHLLSAHGVEVGREQTDQLIMILRHKKNMQDGTN
ncbi:hypothetical protein EW145_g244 [Phellinidium pouzarii]|uniref:C2H2-type domain-containing protein n=1 Tax=Phellinidium pouzarii TaxID=167371 RepID=A0A4S4LJ46_9AGAM|nr:hypothetical protein EW145_g244 [Phellinidium pouzarii]